MSVGKYIIILGILFISFGSYYQFFYSNLFWCGRVEAPLESKLFIGFTIFQSILYLIGDKRFIKLTLNFKYKKITIEIYFLTQLIMGILVLYSFSEFLILYKNFFLCILALILTGAIFLFYFSKEYRYNKLIFWGLLHSLITLIITTSFATLFLYSKYLRLTNINLIILFLISISISLYIIHNLNKETKIRQNITIPPLGFLLLAILRAKQPDGAYDTLLYKGYHPLLFADWRTALTTAYDHASLVTNFQEILNTIFLIIDNNYSPSFISTFSWIYIFLLVPLLIAMLSKKFSIPIMALKIVSLFIFSSVEALEAQGTTYQEPILLLFGILAFIPHPLALLFYAAAIAVKISFIPMIFVLLVYHIINYYKSNFKISKLIYITSLLVIVVLGVHIAKNYNLTRRVLGSVELLASFTDSENKVFSKNNAHTFLALESRGSFANNLVLSACNLWLMDQLCELGNFHVIPGSRIPLVGLLISIFYSVTLLFQKSYKKLIIPLSYLATYVIFVNIFTQGRYFLVLAIASYLPITFMLSDFLLKLHHRFLLKFSLFILFVGELLVGTGINVGWNCVRTLAEKKIDTTYVPSNDIDLFLVKKMKNYTSYCKPFFPPTFFSEWGKFDIKPYLGFHYHHIPFLTNRFLEANKDIQVKNSIAGFLFESEMYIENFAKISKIKEDFYLCYNKNNTKILCNKKIDQLQGCLKPIYEKYLLF